MSHLCTGCKSTCIAINAGSQIDATGNQLKAWHFVQVYNVDVYLSVSKMLSVARGIILRNQTLSVLQQ